VTSTPYPAKTHRPSSDFSIEKNFLWNNKDGDAKRLIRKIESFPMASSEIGAEHSPPARGMSSQSFDILIVGAGIAGASVAARLARTHRIAILEREEYPGYHSTGRSAALFSEIYGNGVVRALSRASRDFFYNPPDGFTQHPLVKPRGSLYIARQEQIPHLEDFAHNTDLAGSIRRMSREEALRTCPALRPDYVAAAVFEDDAADVDVNALHQGYLRQFKNAGGALFVNADVQALAHRDGEWTAQTRDGAFSAPIIVNAAGAWADAVAEKASAMPLKIQPRRRTALLAELPPGVQANTWPMVIDIDESFYLKPDAGLLLISPADETPVPPCDVQPEEIDIAIAVDRVEQATTLNIARIRRRWAGLRSFAPDRSPVIGFDGALPGFFWLAGQGGYGIQTAPAASRLAASLLRGDARPEFDPALIEQLSPNRFTARSGA
jgi:D-arginine dehydrogenase